MIPELYALAVCETCSSPLLYRFSEFRDQDEGRVSDPEKSDFQNARALWPVVTDLTDAVPTGVRRCYQEASRILQIAPTAYAVQIRRSLEALCEDRGAVKGPLNKRLRDLAFKNEIPKVLAEMSDIVRVLGNIGAHANEHQISIYDAKIIDEFFRSIVEYVYEAPKRIQDFRQRLVGFGKSQREQEDGGDASPGPGSSIH